MRRASQVVGAVLALLFASIVALAGATALGFSPSAVVNSATTLADLACSGCVDASDIATGAANSNLTTNTVALNKLVNAGAQNHFQCRKSASSGAWEDCTQAEVQTALSIGTLAAQDASNVNITGGTIAGVTGLGLPDSWFGDGTDGSHTVAGTETLTSGKAYTDLTVPAGTTLITAGYTIAVNGTLTDDGTIKDNGNAAALNVAGATLNTEGMRLSANSSGGTGSASQSVGGVGATGGGISGTTWPSVWGAAGGGGTGGTASGGWNGGGGGTSAATTSDNVVTAGTVLSENGLWVGTSGLFRLAHFGGGGAGGNNPLAGTSTSGGGGGSAGVVWFVVASLTGSGTMTAVGGAGGNAANCTSNGNAGGGGGGTGGLVLGVVNDASGWVGTMSVAGGAGGTHCGVGAADGASGSNGKIAVFGL